MKKVGFVKPCSTSDAVTVWRTLDAQYWGVPQRRKRIYLVADFAGGSAGKILFESEGLSGYSPQSIRSWQGTANGTETCLAAAGIDGYNGSLTDEISSTIGVNCGMSTGRNGVMCLNDQGGQRMDITNDMTTTLRAEAHHPPCVMFENHSQDTRYKEIDVAPTVSATYGTGGNNQPFVTSAGFSTEHSAKSRSIGYEEELSPTLRAGVVPATVTPKTLKIRSGCEGGGKGALIQDKRH